VGQDPATRAVNPRKHLAFATMLGSAVLSQALLSAASLLVGLLLIRHTSDLQYGSYILASSAVLLLISLHGSFINPALVNRLTPLQAEGRGALVGGLFREQLRGLLINTLLAFGISAFLWYVGVLDAHSGPLVLATIAAGFAILQRNYFRMVLAAYRRQHDVLLTDICYAVLLLIGTLLAVKMSLPATATMIVMGLAAGVSGWLAARALWRQQPWDFRGAPGILRSIAPLAALSTVGAAIHWTFSQGYMYVAAGMLDVTAVAALAATRLLMMPVNLLSSGIASLMLPLTAGWLQKEGSAFAFRRLGIFAAGIAFIALCYFAVLWFTRDWIFASVLKKQFADSDRLLALWSVAFLIMVVRDQLIYLLVAVERFRQLTSLALGSAVLSLFAGYVGMTQFGVLGAPLGVLVGEVISVTGIVILSLRFISPSTRASVATEVS